MRESGTLRLPLAVADGGDAGGERVGVQAEVGSVRDGAVALAHPLLGARGVGNHDTSSQSVAVRRVGDTLNGVLEAGGLELTWNSHLDRQVVVTHPQAIDAFDRGD